MPAAAKASYKWELAQLNYMLPRLTGKGTAMSRLGGKSGGGGSGGAGGGAGRIGVRGPGEKKRKPTGGGFATAWAKFRPASMKSANSGRSGAKRANAVPLGTIALSVYQRRQIHIVNALSPRRSPGFLQDVRHLDPTIRALRLPSNRRVLVSDTVGFIRDLPRACNGFSRHS